MAQGQDPNIAMLTTDHYHQVRNAIWDARVQYQNIGIELGISPDDVEAIAENVGGNVEKGFAKVIRQCLKDGISQKRIADALQSRTVGYGHLGREFLAMKFEAPPKEQHHFQANTQHHNSPAAPMTAQIGSTSAVPAMDPRLVEIIDSVPSANRRKLDEEIDFEHKTRGQTIPKHLGKIADSMENWETVAVYLNLGASDKSSIKGKYPFDQELQRRYALEMWKSRLGRKGTYKALMNAFLDAGRPDYAYNVSDLFKNPAFRSTNVAPSVPTSVVSPAAMPHVRATQPGGYIGVESSVSNSAKKPRISSDYGGVHEGTKQHHKPQEKKMTTASTTVPVKGENTPEYLAIRSTCDGLIAVFNDPVNKSRASTELFRAKMITTMSSDISGEHMVSSVLQGISGDVMKFYKSLAILQDLSNHQKILERIHEAFLYEIKQKIPRDTYMEQSVPTDTAFLSFSRQRPYPDSVDSRTYTGKFCRHLQDKGCNPWMDANDIESGDPLSVAIYKTLDMCRAVVPVVTRGYAQSLWCMRELYYAMSRRSVQIHPVVIEDGWEKENAGEWLKLILKDKKMNKVEDPTDEQKMEGVALKIAKALSSTEADQPEPNQPEPNQPELDQHESHVPNEENEGTDSSPEKNHSDPKAPKIPSEVAAVGDTKFCEDMADDEFIQFLKKKGLADIDCQRIKDNGITAKAFATDFTKEDIKDPELGFSYAGKKVLERVWKEIHD